MIAGIVLGAVIGANSRPQGCTGSLCDFGVVPGVLLGGVGGAVVGSIIAAPLKSDHWREVPIERLRVGFGLSFRF